MAERYELPMEHWLATALEHRLTQILRAAGFHDTLHLADPHLTEFQGKDGIVIVEVRHSGSRRVLVVESESVDVAPLLWEAGKETLAAVTEQLIGVLPWVDETRLRDRIFDCLADSGPAPS